MKFISDMTKKQKKVFKRIIAAAFLMIAAIIVPAHSVLKYVFYIISYVVIGYDILIKAVKGIFNKQPFDENFLMALATVGAIALGEYAEGTAVMLFYQIGELFQSCAVGKSRRNISELMDIRPDYANLLKDNGDTERVDPYEVEIGSIILVKPGEKIPIDGNVEEGVSSLNTSALTGESLPKDVCVGERVTSGCVNLTGLLKIKTEKEFSESTVSKILDMVENASSLKSKSEKFISKFAKYYTPIVCISAFCLAFIPPLIRIIFLGVQPYWQSWIYRALTFLVISCPCALVISIPLGFFAGIGGAGRAGVLIKGSNYLETLSKVKCVAFDKTGTLTKGEFKVTDVKSNKLDENKLLEYAAHAESCSLHPISKSIVKAYGKELDKKTEEIKEFGGLGVIARVDGVSVAVGNDKLMHKLNIVPEECEHKGAIVYVAVDNEFAGHILVSDEIRPEAFDIVKELKKIGVQKTAMLTGDVRTVGEYVGEQIGIDEVFSGLMPEDKVSIIEQLISEKRKTAFVGDGINDAPVLSRADIGIAMGALGSDAAIEAADVVLMDDNPVKVAKAIRIAKKCMNIVYQNIFFSIGIKIICLLLGALGSADMWFAIFADVGVMILAVLNAIRTLSIKNI